MDTQKRHDGEELIPVAGKFAGRGAGVGVEFGGPPPRFICQECQKVGDLARFVWRGYKIFQGGGGPPGGAGSVSGRGPGAIRWTRRAPHLRAFPCHGFPLPLTHALPLRGSAPANRARGLRAYCAAKCSAISPKRLVRPLVRPGSGPPRRAPGRAGRSGPGLVAAPSRPASGRLGPWPLPGRGGPT